MAGTDSSKSVDGPSPEALIIKQLDLVRALISAHIEIALVQRAFLMDETDQRDFGTIETHQQKILGMAMNARGLSFGKGASAHADPRLASLSLFSREVSDDLHDSLVIRVDSYNLDAQDLKEGKKTLSALKVEFQNSEQIDNAVSVDVFRAQHVLALNSAILTAITPENLASQIGPIRNHLLDLQILVTVSPATSSTHRYAAAGSFNRVNRSGVVFKTAVDDQRIRFGINLEGRDAFDLLVRAQREAVEGKPLATITPQDMKLALAPGAFAKLVSRRNVEAAKNLADSSEGMGETIEGVADDLKAILLSPTKTIGAGVTPIATLRRFATLIPEPPLLR